MDALSQDAAQLAVGFRLGLVPQDEIVSWADRVIASMEEPPIAAIDLASMGKAHGQDVLRKLGEMSNGQGAVQALPLALKRFAERLRNFPELGPAVARGLWDIYVQSGYDVPHEFTEIAGFDEDYWLARNEAYGTEHDVYKRLLAFFERFEDVV